MTSINRAFLKITCAAATMTAILLVSSGDALARNRQPDTGGEVVKRKSAPVVKRKIRATPYVPGHFYNGTKGRATRKPARIGERELNGFYLPSGQSTHFNFPR
jgi:hypothetical protein